MVSKHQKHKNENQPPFEGKSSNQQPNPYLENEGYPLSNYPPSQNTRASTSSNYYSQLASSAKINEGLDNAVYSPVANYGASYGNLSHVSNAGNSFVSNNNNYFFVDGYSEQQRTGIAPPLNNYNLINSQSSEVINDIDPNSFPVVNEVSPSWYSEKEKNIYFDNPKYPIDPETGQFMYTTGNPGNNYTLPYSQSNWNGVPANQVAESSTISRNRPSRGNLTKLESIASAISTDYDGTSYEGSSTSRDSGNTHIHSHAQIHVGGSSGGSGDKGKGKEHKRHPLSDHHQTQLHLQSSEIHHTSSSSTPSTTEDKTYKCSECEQAFRRSHDLRRHLKTHLKIPPYVCPICTKGFARKDALKVSRKIKKIIKKYIYTIF